MKQKRRLCVGATLVLVLVALGVGQMALEKAAVAQGGSAMQVPTFQVDPMWPKPLPNHWLLGTVIGVAFDSKDHVWILHRPRSVAVNEQGLVTFPPTPDRNGKVTPNDRSRGTFSQICCRPAPPVLEFDQEGNLLRHWGGAGAGYEWPLSEHGLYVDYKDNVWIGGSGEGDAQVLKFSQDGKLLLQIGHHGKSRGSNDTENFNRPTNIDVDPATNEVYVSDGYGNTRVIVFDADTGKYKRHWGAYGKKPDDKDPDIVGETAGTTRYDPKAPPIKQFRTSHAVALSKDGLVYVCDRGNDRIQVFKKDGTYVTETFVEKSTLRSGSVWDVDFSKDPQQTFLYVADGENNRVHILRRNPLQVVSFFGDGGRMPGLFYGVHNLAVDSKGNIFTA